MRSAALVQAAANVAWALPGCALSFIAPECNSFGLALMTDPSLDAASRPSRDAAIVLENDLYRRLPAAGRTLSGALRAPGRARPPGEPRPRRGGTAAPRGHLRRSGRHAGEQRRPCPEFFRVFLPAGAVRESWRWLGPWPTLDDVVAALAAVLPELAAVAQAAPSAGFRMAGAKIPREPHRYSGRTAMVANISVHEPKPPDDPDTRFPSPWGPGSAAFPADPLLLVAGMELHPGGQQISERNRRAAARRRPGRAADRAGTGGAGTSGSFPRHSGRGRANGWWCRCTISSAPRN